MEIYCLEHVEFFSAFFLFGNLFKCIQKCIQKMRHSTLVKTSVFQTNIFRPVSSSVNSLFI